MFQKILYFVLIFIILSAIAIILWISDLFLSVWEKLLLQPDWFFWAYIFAFVLFVLFSLLTLYKILPKSLFFKTKKQTNDKENSESIIAEVDIEQIETRLEKLSDQELDTSKIKEEIEQLKLAQDKKDIRIVLFGDISTGKSSLINAFLPSAEGEVSVSGGTTRDVINHQWISPMGERVVLTDTPGFDEQDRLLDKLSREAVFKSHLAIYLCEGDLTASQFNQIKEVAILGKPLVVAFNKTDQYLAEDVDAISAHIKTRLQEIDKQISLVHIQSGGRKEVTIVKPDGTEEVQIRELKPVLTQLMKSVSSILSKTSPGELESIRQKSVLHLLSGNLDQVEDQYRLQQSKSIVNSSTKKAVIASMATITPGSDLLVQSYLAISMIKDLCRLYDVPVKDVDVEKLLKLLQSNTIGVYPLLLGIAGNGFKAFPGAGTLAGGFMHAVAYGLIFDSVGKAVSLSLSTQGNLLPVLVEDVYKEKLVENIESRTLELVKMVIKSKTDS